MVASRCFQLDENEGSESCISEIVLLHDFSLKIGQTDGPRHIEAVGTWSIGEGGVFSMRLCRTYKTGYSGSDMGEFTFPVERNFSGQASEVGGLLALEGSAHASDDQLGRVKVGYFSILDDGNENWD